MINSNLTSDKKQKDKIEIVKQQQAEIQKVFDSNIRPQKNHTLFEIDLHKLTITEAKFDEVPPIHWHDAVKGLISYTRKCTKKDNCIYISALNIENVHKHLRKQNILTKFTKI